MMKTKTNDHFEAPVTDQKVLGYIRVSTEDQAVNGNGLNEQIRRIQHEALRRGMTLIGIYEDVGSAVGAGSFYKREDLTRVLRIAKHEGVPVIVSKLDRLSREPTTMNDILNLDGVQIISCDPREMRSRRSVKRAARKAKQTATNTSEGTRRKLAEKKARGETLGNPDTLVEGRKTSARVRKMKSSAIVDSVAILLDRTPDLANKTAREIADALNQAGITTSRGMPWSLDNIRDVLRKARKQLAEQAEIEDEEGDVPSQAEVFGSETTPQPTPEPEPTSERLRTESVKDYHERMRKQNPNWGRF